MSRRTLSFEEACIEQTWDVAGVTGAAFVRWAVGSRTPLSRLSRSSEFLSHLEQAHDRLLEDSAAYVREMLARVREEALTSIEDELGWCEDTMAGRYAGTADVALLVARLTSSSVVTDMTEAYLRSGMVWGELYTQAAQAARLAEDAAEFEARMLSAEPVKARGHQGSGLWVQEVRRKVVAIRAVSVVTQNAVRGQGMRAFNDAAR